MVGHGHVVVDSRGVRAAEMERIGARLAAALKPGDLVLLYGPLGAGKTTLVRAVARSLGVTDAVRSPSFTIANIYQGRVTVQHLDLYRLERIEDDDALALEEYVDGDAVTFVEWPEAGAGRLGAADWSVRIEHDSAETRTIQIVAETGEARSSWEEAGRHD